jgi:hypothetical protein
MTKAKWDAESSGLVRAHCSNDYAYKFVEKEIDWLNKVGITLTNPMLLAPHCEQNSERPE